MSSSSSTEQEFDLNVQENGTIHLLGHYDDSTTGVVINVGGVIASITRTDKIIRKGNNFTVYRVIPKPCTKNELEFFSDGSGDIPKMNRNIYGSSNSSLLECSKEIINSPFVNARCLFINNDNNNLYPDVDESIPILLEQELLSKHSILIISNNSTSFENDFRRQLAVKNNDNLNADVEQLSIDDINEEEFNISSDSSSSDKSISSSSSSSDSSSSDKSTSSSSSSDKSISSSSSSSDSSSSDKSTSSSSSSSDSSSSDKSTSSSSSSDKSTSSSSSSDKSISSSSSSSDSSSSDKSISSSSSSDKSISSSSSSDKSISSSSSSDKSISSSNSSSDSSSSDESSDSSNSSPFDSSSSSSSLNDVYYAEGFGNGEADGEYTRNTIAVGDTFNGRPYYVYVNTGGSFIVENYLYWDGVDSWIIEIAGPNGSPSNMLYSGTAFQPEDATWTELSGSSPAGVFSREPFSSSSS